MRVIFQDIDGVLYPCYQRRFLFGDGKAVKAACCKEDPVLFHDADERDLFIAAKAWDKAAVQRLRHILEVTDARLVISSSWKFARSLRQLQQLFGAVGLAAWVIDRTDPAFGFMKEPGIKGYLRQHPEVISYVVLDDLNMQDTFSKRSIVCPDVLDDACMQTAICLLQQEGE